MPHVVRTIEDAQALIGTEVGVSDWVLIDQARINKFADATDDHQWIHVDPDRAARDLPIGSVIKSQTMSFAPTARGGATKNACSGRTTHTHTHVCSTALPQSANPTQ